MSEVIITVRGEHENRIPAEVGVARVSVRLDGPKREDVMADASTLAAAAARGAAGTRRPAAP